MHGLVLDACRVRAALGGFTGYKYIEQTHIRARAVQSYGISVHNEGDL